MLKRKRRKGFWWYSWILILLAVGGTVGGYFYGQKRWEEGPKEYRSTAIVQTDIRMPFSRVNESGGGQGTNPNRSETKRVLKGVETIRPVMRVLNLTNRWTLSEAEALTLLSNSVDIQISDKDEITIKVTRDSAEEAAEIANAIAAQTTESLVNFKMERKKDALRILDEDLKTGRAPIDQLLETARIVLKSNGLPIEPTVETDLTPYLEIKEVLEVNVDLEGAKEYFATLEKTQTKERLYWGLDQRAPEIVQPAEIPATFSGPDKLPIQKEFALYGLTAGILLGLILMFLLWKMFTPKLG